MRGLLILSEVFEFVGEIVLSGLGLLALLYFLLALFFFSLALLFELFFSLLAALLLLLFLLLSGLLPCLLNCSALFHLRFPLLLL